MSAVGVVVAAGGSGSSVSYASAAALVLLGSVIPVVPTGPTVSAVAALAIAGRGSELVVLAVLALCALAAFTGDVITFAVFRYGPTDRLRWLARRRSVGDAVTERFSAHGEQLIVVGRLVPAARIPALAAAALVDYPWPRFLPAAAAGAVAWTACYSVLGAVGGSIFARHPWLAALSAALLCLAVDLGLHVIRRLSTRRRLGRTS